MNDFIRKIEKVVLKEVGALKTCLNLKQVKKLCSVKLRDKQIKEEEKDVQE